MKKYFIFLLTLSLLIQSLWAQQPNKKEVNKKYPHLTFNLHNDVFYYSYGVDTAQLKIAVLDSVTLASIINRAIVEHKVAPKNLYVVLQGDDLILHRQFELLLNTILNRTVNEVRLKTKLFD